MPLESPRRAHLLFAHGWQKLVIKGIGGTYAWFQAMGIPLAIVSTSFVTVVEFVGGTLVATGAGRFSVDHLVHRGRQARAMPPTTALQSPPGALPAAHQPGDPDQTLFAKPISAPTPSPKPR
jgi:DoxX-like protein